MIRLAMQVWACVAFADPLELLFPELLNDQVSCASLGSRCYY